MNLDFTPEELAFQQEVRAFFAEKLTPDLRRANALTPSVFSDPDIFRRWQRILFERGWAATSWPTEFGGTGWSTAQQYIFEVENAIAGAPPLLPQGLRMVGPVIMKFGTQAQKDFYLPRILTGEDYWCQGYSEPGSGSDLASLKTRAVRDGDDYLINGSKIWTSHAQFANRMFALVRTADSPKKQDGISFILIDMKTPGITVRPLILMDGGHEVNEVFFDNVEVPVENLVHEEGKGWTVAKYLLGHERMGSGNVGGSRRELVTLKELARRELKNGQPLIDDPRFRDKLSRVEIELDALEVTSMRFLDKMRRTGQPPGADVSMLKIRGTEVQQMITELMMQAAGPMAAPFKAVDNGSIDFFTSRLAPRYFNYRKASIYAGSNEIQRNIIAKASLGL